MIAGNILPKIMWFGQLLLLNNLKVNNREAVKTKNRNRISYSRVMFSSLAHNAVHIFISYRKDVGGTVRY